MLHLHRIPTWRSRLIREIDIWRRREFAYGDADCIAFAGACVEAMTGVNPADRFAGQYSDPHEAWARMAQEGYPSLAAAVAQHLPVKPRALARFGDLAIVPAPRGHNAFPDALGVVNGSTIIVRTRRGVAAIPLSQATKVFEV